MAAPVVAGVVALILAEAKAKGQALSIDQIRNILEIAARKNPPTLGWHPRYGTGRIDANAAVSQVQAMPPVVDSPT